MAKTQATGNIQKVGTGASNMPAFMKRDPGAELKSTQGLKDFIIVPRAKVVQKSAGEEVRKIAGTGDIILSPIQVMLAKIDRDASGNPAKTGSPIFFTPLFFFVDWATWNPYDMKGKLPTIAYQTNNPKDPIVAKSKNKDLRREALMDPNSKQQLVVNGKPQFVRHVEQLNWIVVAHGEGMPIDPFVLTFAKGEHWSGQKFAGLIRQRNAEMFGCQFQLTSGYRPDRGNGDWYGFDVTNPPEDVGGWVSDQDAYARYEMAHDKLAKDFADRGIRADMSDAEDLQQAEEGGEVDTNPATRSM